MATESVPRDSFEGSAEQARILKLREMEGLLVEADAIVKLCAGNEPLPGDEENAVQGVALGVVSKLITQALEVMDRGGRAS